MDHDQWGALALFIIVLIMLLPSTVDKAKRKLRARNTIKPDFFFDRITEFRK